MISTKKEQIYSSSIRLESKGAVVYKSKRVGSNYKIFDFLKFRSMYTDADKHLRDFNQLNQYQTEEEPELSGEEFLIGDDIELNEEETMLISDDFIISERKQLDIKYAQTFSFLLDMEIILRTFTAFIQKENV